MLSLKKPSNNRTNWEPGPKEEKKRYKLRKQFDQESKQLLEQYKRGKNDNPH